MTEQVLRTYLQCGLRLRSEIELHLPLAPDEGADVEVRWGPDIHDSSESPPGELIAAFGSGEDSWYTATATGSQYLVRFRDCGEFVISGDLSAVQVRRDPAGRFEILPILMAGTVSALLLTLRGETVLHASAVAVDGASDCIRRSIRTRQVDARGADVPRRRRPRHGRRAHGRRRTARHVYRGRARAAPAAGGFGAR